MHADYFVFTVGYLCADYSDCYFIYVFNFIYFLVNFSQHIEMLNVKWV